MNFKKVIKSFTEKKEYIFVCCLVLFLFFSLLLSTLKVSTKNHLIEINLFQIAIDYFTEVKISLLDLFNRFLNIVFLKNTNENDFSSDALSIICAIIVAIPTFLLPLFFNVFEDKIKENTANYDFIFEQILKQNEIRKFYIYNFIFIIYLVLQNYVKWFYWGNLTYFINILATIYFIWKTSDILEKIILKNGNELVKDVYNRYLKNTKNKDKNKIDEKSKGLCELKNNEKFIILYYCINDMIYFINENKTGLFLKRYDDFFEFSSGCECIDYFCLINDKNVISCSFINVISEAVKNIELNESYFERIIRNTDSNENKKYYLYYSFKELNKQIWQKNNNQESNYIRATSLENQHYKSIFKENCRKIIEGVLYLKFVYSKKLKDEANKLEDLQNIFNNSHYQILKDCILCIYESLKTGNRDSIDYFLDELFHFVNDFSIDNSNYDFLYEYDIRTKFFTYYSLNSNDGIVQSFIDEDWYQFINRNKTSNIIIKRNANNFTVFDFFLENIVLDFSYLLFEECSKKYLRFLEEKYTEQKNIFILDVIKKVKNFKPILDINSIHGYKQIQFFNSRNIFFSIIRLFTIEMPGYQDFFYSNFYFIINNYFIESYNMIPYECDLYGYKSCDFKIILLLLCNDNLSDIDEKQIVQTLELNCKSYLDMCKLKDCFKELKDNINKIDYNKYKTYINNVFDNSSNNDEIFEENKKKLIGIIDKIVEQLHQCVNTIIKKSKIDTERSQSLLDRIKSKIKTYSKEDRSKCRYLNLFGEIKNKSDMKNADTLNFSPIFDKAAFLEINNYYGIEDAYVPGFFKSVDHRYFCKFLISIQNIQKEVIEKQKLVDDYLNEDADYIIITNTDNVNDNIVLEENEKHWFSNNESKILSKWINAKWHCSKIDFLSDKSVICIPKNYFDRIEIDMDNIAMDLKEIENNNVIVSAKADIKLYFNDKEFNEIKIFEIVENNKSI